MKLEFPCCGKLKPRIKERRYLPASYQEHYSTVRTDLFHVQCPVCLAEFVAKKEVPLDAQLESIVTLGQEWGQFNSAKPNKPGIVAMGTTISEYSDIAHRSDPFYFLKRYINTPALVG